MQNLHACEHFHCLDLFRITSPAGARKAFCDCAILLEIWDFGGLMQTSLALPQYADYNPFHRGRDISESSVL